MKNIDLYNLVRNGKQPIVKFTENVYEWIEESVDPQMMAKIIGASMPYDDGYCFKLDLNRFEEYNRSVARNDWRDKNGNTTLTWFETGYYPKDGIETIYLPLEGEAPLTFIDEDSLLNEYVKSECKSSYIEWLEDVVRRLRSK